MLEYSYFFFVGLFFILTFLPLIKHPHWIFRVAEFGKLQLLVLQLICLTINLFLLEFNTSVLVFHFLLLTSLLYNAYVLLYYISFFRKSNRTIRANSKNPISIISANVYQFNSAYHRFISLIKKENPDLILTLESDEEWEKALTELCPQYPYRHAVPLKNTYGMHFYSKLKITDLQEHYFVAEDLPSLEIDLESKSGESFTVFGIHPPPPSPTEEEHSSERDGELLSIAKRIIKSPKRFFVIGDFNTVSWARSAVMFKKTSKLMDARKGRGLLSTFHADYFFLRFPIDLIYHSPSIIVKEVRILPHIGSDHLPVYCSFCLPTDINEKKEDLSHLKKEERIEVNKIIEEGMKYESEREKIATK